MNLLKLIFWQIRVTTLAFRMRRVNSAAMQARLVYATTRFNMALGAANGKSLEIEKYREMTADENLRGAVMEHMSNGARAN